VEKPVVKICGYDERGDPEGYRVEVTIAGQEFIADPRTSGNGGFAPMGVAEERAERVAKALGVEVAPFRKHEKTT